MILVIEGPNGAGKSSLVQALGMDRFKPFRPSADAHWDQAEGVKRREQLAALGIPLNTYVEDVFAAEFLGSGFGRNIALDRSMPSALAYGALDGTVPDAAKRRLLLAEWQSSLGRRPDVFYLYLTCQPRVSRERAGSRAHTAAAGKTISSILDKCFVRITWPKLQIDTTETEPAEVAKRVRKWLDSHR